MDTTKIAACVVLASLACLDLHTRRLPNTVVAAFAALYFVHAGLTDPAPLSLATHGLAAGIAFGVAALLFRLGWLAGGDVKLASAVFLWAGPESWTVFVIVSLCGSLIAFAALAVAQLARIAVIARITRWLRWLDPARGVPYGVALAAGGCIAVLLQPAIGHAAPVRPRAPSAQHQTAAMLSAPIRLA